MALDLSGLAAYVEENSQPLIQSAILSPKVLDYVTKWENVKSTVQLPTLESTVPYQAGASCNSVTTSGTTTIGKVQLATSAIEFAESICINDLEAYFTQKYLPKGANVDTFSILQDILNRKLAKVAIQNEQLIFQGKTTYTNSTVLKQINGFISTIDTAGTAVTATATTWSLANARTIMEEIIFQKIPNAIIGNSPVVMIGQDNFRTLLQKLWVDNLFAFSPQGNEQGAMEFTYPGTNVKVVAFAGLNSDTPVDTGALPSAVKNRIIVATKDNLHVGMDLASDSSNIETWYEKKERKLYIYGRFRLGVQATNINQIVTGNHN